MLCICFAGAMWGYPTVDMPPLTGQMKDISAACYLTPTDRHV